MSRTKQKTVANCKIKRWLSGGLPCNENRFLMVGCSFYEHPAVISLSSGAFKLYHYMAKAAGQNNTVEFCRTDAKNAGIPESTYKRNISELIDKGFIEKISCGKATRQPNIYRLIFNLSP